MPEKKTYSKIDTEEQNPSAPDSEKAAQKVDDVFLDEKGEKAKRKKAKDDKKNNGEAMEIAYDTNTRDLICTPDKAGRGTVRALIGMAFRVLVIAFAVFSLVLFFSDAFKIEVPTSAILGYSLVICFAIAMMFSTRRLRIPGIVITVAGIAYAIVRLPLIRGIITYYNALLQRLIDAEYYSYISLKIDIVNIPYTEEYLLKIGAMVICFALAAVFVPLLAKRITLSRLIPPAVLSTAMIMVVFTYNISRSNWATSMLIASLGSLIVMYGCDKIFAKVGARQQEDSDQILFESDRPELPPEVAEKNARRSEKKRIKNARKLALKQHRAEMRALDKKRKREGVTVDEELSRYLSVDNSKKRKHKAERHSESNIDSAHTRMTSEEKKAFSAERKKERAEQRRQERENKRAIRRGLNKVRSYDDAVKCSRSAAGGFASIGSFVLLLAVLLVPTVSIDRHFTTFEKLNKSLESYREYISAWLRGDDPILDIMDYSKSDENSEPHNTDAIPRQFTGETLFTLTAQNDTNTYLRGWIGVEYKDGYWYAADEDSITKYRDLFGIEYDPKEMMLYNFYKLMDPDAVASRDYLTRYGSVGSKYGFVSMLVNIDRKETGSMYVYMPSYYDTDIGLLNYGTLDASELSYVNYFDGIYVGRAFKTAAKYSSVSYVTTMKDANWYKNLAVLIAKYNEEKEKIQSYGSSNQSNTLGGDTISYIDPETGYLVNEIVNSDGYVVKIYRDSNGTIVKTETGTEQKELSLFDRYRSYMTDKEKSAVNYAYHISDLYSDFVYDTYLKKSYNETIAKTATQIINESKLSDDPLDVTTAILRDSVTSDTYVQRHKIVMAIIDWLIANTEYTLEPTASADPELGGVENFLLVQKQGYCVQYASAVTLMLRQLGIPARYVEGYIGDGYTYNRGGESEFRYSSVVKDSNAHAWVEVWFDGVGWIQYECTPAYYDDMYYIAKSDDPQDPSQRPSGDVDIITPEDNFDEEEYELSLIGSRISGYSERINGIGATLDSCKPLVSEEDLSNFDQLQFRYDVYLKRYNDLEKQLEAVKSGALSKEDYDSNAFVSSCIYLYHELYELDDLIEPLEINAAEYAAMFKKIKDAVNIALTVLAIAAVIVTVLALARRARNKHIRKINAIINSPIAEEDRRDTATMLIDKTAYLLKLYGSAPAKGEFRHEYAKRLSFEYETLFGFPSEYATDEDVVAERAKLADENNTDRATRRKAQKLEKAMKKRARSEAKKAGRKFNKHDLDISFTASSASRTNIGEILDSIAAEEFGGQMSEAEIKELAKFYLKLYRASYTRLSPADWVVRHCLRHQV